MKYKFNKHTNYANVRYFFIMAVSCIHLIILIHQKIIVRGNTMTYPIFILGGGGSKTFRMLCGEVLNFSSFVKWKCFP